MKRYRTRSNKRFCLRRNRNGAAYVLAVTTLLAGITLGLAMLRASGAYFMSEDTRQRKQAAMNLAEAGIGYAYWQVHYANQPLPYTADVTLSTGRFHVEAVDDGNREPSTMLITSTGTVGKHSHTVRRVTLGLLPYHYAYCENRNTDDGDALNMTGAGLGMRANGSIKLDSLLNNITAGAWATTTISTKGWVQPRYPGSPPIYFPEIDYSYYNSVATHKYWSDRWYTFLDYPSGAIIYVSGRVYIRGWYRGCITVVATGDIIINGSLSPADSNSYMALITREDIYIDYGAGYVDAIMYAHRSGLGSEANINGYTTICGLVASDDNTTTSTTNFSRNTKLTLAIMRQLKLPGL